MQLLLSELQFFHIVLGVSHMDPAAVGNIMNKSCELMFGIRMINQLLQTSVCSRAKVMGEDSFHYFLHGLVSLSFHQFITVIRMTAKYLSSFACMLQFHSLISTSYCLLTKIEFSCYWYFLKLALLFVLPLLFS